jgi:hypothetical protein
MMKISFDDTHYYTDFANNVSLLYYDTENFVKWDIDSIHHWSTLKIIYDKKYKFENKILTTTDYEFKMKAIYNGNLKNLQMFTQLQQKKQNKVFDHSYDEIKDSLSIKVV